MNSTASPITSRLAAPAAMAAATALAVSGIIQITDTASGEATVVGIEHVTLAALTVLTLALIPVALHLGRLAGRTFAGVIPSVGMGLLAPLTVVSNVRGEDPSFFAAVAVPSNLLWFGGFIALAIALKRSGRVPSALAVALPLTWVLSLPGSSVGLGVIAAAYWLAFAWMVHTGELPRRTVAPVTA